MDDLTDRLTRLAERTAPPPREDLAAAVVARHRRDRRRRTGTAAVAVAVAAVVVAVPVVVRGGDDPAPATGVAAPGSVPDGVLDGPPRGSLAGDAAFVEGVRRLPWSGDAAGVPEPALDGRRVVFAGEVAGQRWALVAAPNGDQPAPLVPDPELETDLGARGGTVAAWFTGPAGAAPEQMAVHGLPRVVDPAQPLASADPVTGAVVVVTEPGDVVSVSERPEVAADGTASRTWARVDAPDGVALVDRGPSPLPSDAAYRYRVERDGTEVITTMPDTPWSQFTQPELDVAWARPQPAAAPGDQVLRAEMDALLARTGLGPDDVAFSVLWAGDVPAPTVGTARLAVFTATLPSGAVYVGTTAGVAVDRTGSAGWTCGSELRAAGDGDRVVAAVCDVTDASADSPVLPTLVVVAPAGTASARLLDTAGGVLGEVPLVDGVAAVGPPPDGLASVETLDAAGAVLERAEPLGEALLE
ncbi:hypothetical protein [Geodermatophilus nigrescens]|uniref:Uncharacterized protein n=1 Tax=Geodermatophilus nigrescens TaxID=1070870 RepID=A0A1M5S9J5_9ACTN|nr:hypothetical protein [Geodermatophilus nigrescens]SHH35161.1 hypothetical protein SAMN05444351_4597 [Geodermatophilus nigrescens]